METSPDKFLPQLLASITMSASRTCSYFSKISGSRAAESIAYGFGCEEDEDDAAATEY